MLRSWASSIFYNLCQDEPPEKPYDRFSYHNDAVATKQWVHEGFTEQHAVRHIAYSCALSIAYVLETNGVSDLRRVSEDHAEMDESL